MAVKQSGRKQYKTMQGKMVDMDLLRQRNELTPAVGNARVNARGDELGPGGKIIKKREDVLGEYYRDHPQAVPNEVPGEGVSEPDAESKDAIEKVAKEFGFAPSIIDGIKSGYSEGQLSNPYKVLGVSKESSDQEIKDVYRKLIKENHPDMLIAKGMPEEFVETANNKMAQINSAYEEIEKLED